MSAVLALTPLPAHFEGRAVTTFDYQASRALGGSYWRVLEPLTLVLDAQRSQWVTVPAGYLTDGASVPRMFWSVVDRWDWYAAAVIVHDLLCEYLTVMTPAGLVPITRQRCDQILDIALAALEREMGFADTPTSQRRTITHGVGLYREVSGVDRPTNTAVKRRLESSWPVSL